MIKIFNYNRLDRTTKDYLNSIIDAEFGHIPIVQNTAWAVPDWTMIYYDNNTMTAFYNIVEREIIIDDFKIMVAGINNVITLKNYRGKGYAFKLLSETRKFIFEELKFPFGLLLCADALIPYYEKLNWYKINCPVYYSQPDGNKRWEANAMLLSKAKNVHPNHIDLNGLPW